MYSHQVYNINVDLAPKIGLSTWTKMDGSLVPRLSRKEPGTHCVRMRLIKTEKLRVGERAHRK